VNGQNFAWNALVWDGDLYVKAQFLGALGLSVQPQGSTLVLNQW